MKRPPKSTPRLYEQDGKGYGATVFAHYFIGGSDWLITEYDPGEDIGFGWVCLNGDRDMAELGYVSLAELEAYRGKVRMTSAQGVPVAVLPTRVEYDEGWESIPLTEAIELLDRRQGR